MIETISISVEIMDSVETIVITADITIVIRTITFAFPASYFFQKAFFSICSSV